MGGMGEQMTPEVIRCITGDGGEMKWNPQLIKDGREIGRLACELCGYSEKNERDVVSDFTDEQQ